jgi:hypothetical protein
MDDGEPGRRIVAGTPAARLREAVEALGVTILDPSQALRAAAAQEAVYYRSLPTWNAAGHRVAAGLLARVLGPDVIPPHDAPSLAAELHRAVPVGAGQSRFDGGFRPSRDRPQGPVRWERVASHAW